MNNIRHTPVCTTHPDVMMDDCHIDLIHSLVLASKPREILEIGIGSGAVTKSILDAISKNSTGTLTCVDDFGDWWFNEPEGLQWIRDRANFIKCHERDFLTACKDEEYDFMVSDGDHAHCGEWAPDTLRVLSAGGILIYHDSTSEHCPSVSMAVDFCRNQGCLVLTFNKNSLPHERCYRGLSVISKP